MRLFTFSSKNNSIKLLFIFLTGFILYSLILHIVRPSVTAFQNQAIRNYSIAEKYIYAKDIHKAVIVGSSMSSRLLKDLFDDDVYNLSFGGGSVLTGLSIIKKSQHIPDHLFIESNVSYRGNDDEMIKNLFVPVLWEIKGNVLALQYTYQPINIVLSKIRAIYEKISFFRPEKSPNEKVLKANLKIHLIDNRHPNTQVENKELFHLKQLVSFFQQKGTKITFFEMPVHADLLSSRKYVELRSILQNLFPDQVFYWADKSGAVNYLTSDGVHLLHKSACNYSKLLSGIIQQELHRSVIPSAVSGDTCR